LLVVLHRLLFTHEPFGQVVLRNHLVWIDQTGYALPKKCPWATSSQVRSVVDEFEGSVLDVVVRRHEPTRPNSNNHHNLNFSETEFRH
jgi:hypothetical protein